MESGASLQLIVYGAACVVIVRFSLRFERIAERCNETEEIGRFTLGVIVSFESCTEFVEASRKTDNLSRKLGSGASILLLIDPAASALIADSWLVLSSVIDGINGLVAGASEQAVNFDWKGRYGMGND